MTCIPLSNTVYFIGLQLSTLVLAPHKYDYVNYKACFRICFNKVSLNFLNRKISIFLRRIYCSSIGSISENTIIFEKNNLICFESEKDD